MVLSLYRRKRGSHLWLWVASACLDEGAVLEARGIELRRTGWQTNLVYTSPDTAATLTTPEQLATHVPGRRVEDDRFWVIS
jgi:hypothetical protein